MITRWSFRVENGGDNFPEALRTKKMSLIFDCEFQFFTSKKENKNKKIPGLTANCLLKMAIPLRVFQEHTEATFLDLFSKLPIDSAYSESLDMKGLVRLALSLASAEVPLRVCLKAVTVVPFEEIKRMRETGRGKVSALEFVKVKDKDECCGICLEKLVGRRAVETECKHIYHKPCFDKLQSYGGLTCPMCRVAIWGDSSKTV